MGKGSAWDFLRDTVVGDPPKPKGVIAYER